MEKVPFFILSAVLSVVTYVAQKRVGALELTHTLSLAVRVSNAIISYVAYIGKMVWPVRLAVYYPYRDSDALALWRVFGATLLIALVSICLSRLSRRRKYLLVGWLWYLGTLLPMIGFIQAGGQAMADRYTYIPYVGLFIVAVWGVSDLLQEYRCPKALPVALSLLILSILTMCTYFQLHHWRNTWAVFSHALAATQNNDIAHHSLACVLAERGRIDEAIAHDTEAVRINPDLAIAHNGLGACKATRGQLEDARRHLALALALKPNLTAARRNLARVHQRLGARATLRGYLLEAQNHWTASMRLYPDWPAPVVCLARLKAIEGSDIYDPNGALELAEDLRNGRRADASVLYILSTTYGALGRYDEAIETGEMALSRARASANRMMLMNQIANQLDLYRQKQ